MEVAAATEAVAAVALVKVVVPAVVEEVAAMEVA